MKKLSQISAVLASLALAIAASAGIASAQTTYSSQTTQTAQPVYVVQPTNTTATTATTGTVSVSPLSTEIALGSSGTDVTNLQTFLATNSSIYPEGLVTGFYGSLTEAAVMRFQEAYGISATGDVGPVTLNEINDLITSGQGMTGANLSLITTADASSGSTTTTTTQATVTATPTTTASLTGGSGPSITNIQVTGFNNGTNTTGTESATITWNVSEPAQSSVFYLSALNTTSNPSLGESAMTSTTGFATNDQSAVITNLTPGTQYNFVIFSTDLNGNVGISYPSVISVDSNGNVTATINQNASLSPIL